MAHFNVSTVVSLRNVSAPDENIGILLTKVCDFFAEFESELYPNSNDPDDKEGAEELLQTLSTVAMIGYFWAQFEICQNIAPLAKAGIKARDALRYANERSTARKKADAETRWKRRARAYIVTLYNQNPCLPKAEIIRRVCGKLDGEIDLPANRLIGDLVDDMREKNQIGPRTSNLSKPKPK